MSTSYRDLGVWQKGMDLAVAIYRATEDFPKRETYGLAAQMRSSAASVPGNIAEGYGRRTARQRYKFLEDALGSAYEIETWVELATRLGYLESETAESLSIEIRKIGRGLHKLMEYVAKEAKSQPRKRPATAPSQ